MSEEINTELKSEINNMDKEISVKKQKEEILKDILLAAIKLEEIDEKEILRPDHVKNMLRILKEEMDKNNSDIICGNFLYLTKNDNNGVETIEAGIMIPVIEAKNFSDIIGKFDRLLH